MKQIKRKTFSWKIHTLNILLNVSDSIEINDENKNISSIIIDKEQVESFTENQDIQKLFPKLKNKFTKKEGLELFVNAASDINRKTMQENEVYDEVFKPKKPIITLILIAICIIVFILMYIIGDGTTNSTLIMFGANVPSLVKDGQIWRLLTSIFLHANVLHLIVNMYSLWVIGRQLESFLGRWKYLVVFLGSGLLGSLFSSVIYLNTISVGASGAIFGLLGSLLYFGYHYRLYLGTAIKTQVIPIIILNIVLGILNPGIDNFAHIGGLIGGYFITCAVGIPHKSKKSDKINGLIVTIALFAFLFFMLFR